MASISASRPGAGRPVTTPVTTRLPQHVGLIPDGNRRWAEARGMAKQAGYAAGIDPGLALLEECRALGIAEVSIYGFTKENVHRPPPQVGAFKGSCVAFAQRAAEAGAALRVIGDTRSALFPRELATYSRRSRGDLRVNLLVNYGWQWDLQQGSASPERCSLGRRTRNTRLPVASSDVPRVDLVVRWGGRRRLSGFLPLQCAYADLFVVNTLWPDMALDEFHEALHWYSLQETTLGG
jgi:undecaprenyl diphosphate synthase